MISNIREVTRIYGYFCIYSYLKFLTTNFSLQWPQFQNLEIFSNSSIYNF